MEDMHLLHFTDKERAQRVLICLPGEDAFTAFRSTFPGEALPSQTTMMPLHEDMLRHVNGIYSGLTGSIETANRRSLSDFLSCVFSLGQKVVQNPTAGTRKHRLVRMGHEPTDEWVAAGVLAELGKVQVVGWEREMGVSEADPVPHTLMVSVLVEYVPDPNCFGGMNPGIAKRSTH